MPSALRSERIVYRPRSKVAVRAYGLLVYSQFRLRFSLAACGHTQVKWKIYATKGETLHFFVALVMQHSVATTFAKWQTPTLR